MAAVAAGYEYATVRARKVERGAAVLVSAIKNGRLGATNKRKRQAANIRNSNNNDAMMRKMELRHDERTRAYMYLPVLLPVKDLP